MSALAPTLQAFFTERLVSQRRASAHTIAAYRDAFCLLLGFVERKTGRAPAALDIEDLNAKLVGAFLDHLECDRHNSVRTRNSRLAAIHSPFRFAALRHPAHPASTERVLATPPNTLARNIVSFLTDEEIEALLAAPDPRSFLGRRDHALLLTAIQTGLRVSELIGLTCHDVVLGTGAHVRCSGKGRKERATPLTASTVAVLAAWLDERGVEAHQPLLPPRQGTALSRYGVPVLVPMPLQVSTWRCPSPAPTT